MSERHNYNGRRMVASGTNPIKALKGVRRYAANGSVLYMFGRRRARIRRCVAGQPS